MKMKLLNAEEAATFLGISANRVRQLAREGRIGRKLGREYIFRPRELEQFKALDRDTGFRYGKKRRKRGAG